MRVFGRQSPLSGQRVQSLVLELKKRPRPVTRRRRRIFLELRRERIGELIEKGNAAP